jgi:hypothetical protein
VLRLSLLLAACSVHAPTLNGCPRAIVEVVTAGEECVRLESVRDALFRLDTSESCGGPPCLVLEPGQTAYVLERIRPGFPAEWRAVPVDCEAAC